MKLWQQQNETNLQVFQRATHLLEEWRATQVIRSRSSTQTTVPHVRSIRQEEDNRKKPAPDKYKCNIDASFSTSLNRVGLGMCLRHDDGAFVLARTEWLAPLCDIDVGEVVGLHTTLDWISNQQFDNVDFVLDCKRVVDCVNSSLDDSSEFGCIITVCKQLLVDRFQNSHVEFNIRQANRVAHELAQVALVTPYFY
jgi:ribonuclease HI